MMKSLAMMDAGCNTSLLGCELTCSNQQNKRSDYLCGFIENLWDSGVEIDPHSIL